MTFFRIFILTIFIYLFSLYVAVVSQIQFGLVSLLSDCLPHHSVFNMKFILTKGINFGQRCFCLVAIVFFLCGT